MPTQYNKNDILEMCEDAMKNPALFYTQKLVNYQGICPDARIPYTEIIAEYLIDHLATYTAGLPTLRRSVSITPPRIRENTIRTRPAWKRSLP